MLRCKKKFTRHWNLERHLQDIHKNEYRENNMLRQKYEAYTFPSTIKYEDYRNPQNSMGEMNFYQNHPEYYNFTSGFSNYDMYNNMVYENVEAGPIDKKESRLTIRDMAKIPYALIILRNYLQRFEPHRDVMSIIRSLYYQCYTQRSIQPLKDFYKKNNLGHLWPL
jgi:hypothetical protein